MPARRRGAWTAMAALDIVVLLLDWRPGRTRGEQPEVRRLRLRLCQPFFSAAAPPCTFSGLSVTLPPAMRSHVPVGTRIQASESRSAVAVPAHALLLVPQSFFPALTMPAHFSVSPLAASAALLATPRP